MTTGKYLKPRTLHIRVSPKRNSWGFLAVATDSCTPRRSFSTEASESMYVIQQVLHSYLNDYVIELFNSGVIVPKEVNYASVAYLTPEQAKKGGKVFPEPKLNAVTVPICIYFKDDKPERFKLAGYCDSLVDANYRTFFDALGYNVQAYLEYSTRNNRNSATIWYYTLVEKVGE